ncbi:MAG: hypothetical protein KY468_18505, partial [Armatimonadetes bacterium]|nr:hypothetical protein [Armatimonadota bacterium]
QFSLGREFLQNFSGDILDVGGEKRTWPVFISLHRNIFKLLILLLCFGLGVAYNNSRSSSYWRESYRILLSGFRRLRPDNPVIHGRIIWTHTVPNSAFNSMK